MVTCRACKRDGPHYLGDDHEGIELQNGVMALPLLNVHAGVKAPLRKSTAGQRRQGFNLHNRLPDRPRSFSPFHAA